VSDPLSNVEQMIDQWERNAAEKAARYENMRQEVEQISITESAADGAVRVTVGHNGIPTGVEMTDGVSRLRPEEIAAAVMQAMTRAQGRYPAELARVMGETVGDDAATRHILDVAEQNFPAPEPETGTSAAQPRYGYEAGEEEPPPPPRPRPSHRPTGPDDDDFSDKNILE
jgi:DNA-binding protein YbaB